MPTNAILVENLSKQYKGVRAVDGISFAVPAGRTYGLLGGNGAGKTTTLSMLLGLLTPTSGTIHMLGRAMPRERAYIAADMNFSSPYVDLPGRLTVRQILTFYSHLYAVKGHKERIAELIELLALKDFIGRPYSTLSAGQQTRVSLAKALINRPKVLLLDEPTASLDPDAADWVRGVFKAYQDETGATILLASHNMPEVEQICHSILMMREGKIVDSGTPKGLIEKYGRENMEQVFLHIARKGALA